MMAGNIVDSRVHGSAALMLRTQVRRTTGDGARDVVPTL